MLQMKFYNECNQRNPKMLFVTNIYIDVIDIYNFKCELTLLIFYIVYII